MTATFEVETAFEEGHSPRGTRALSVDEFVKLAHFAESKLTMVHTVEAFVLKGGDEVAAPEFSLYGPDRDAENLSWSAQVVRAASYVRDLADDARKHSDPIVFQVWLTDRD